MRVLFVVKEYLPKPTPPGLCVMNVRQALFEQGVYSDVLMTGNIEGMYSKNEIGEIFCIESKISFEKKKEGIVDYLRVHIPMIFTWPVPSMKRVKDYRRMILKLNKEKKYDAIIGTLFPADVCMACYKFDHFLLYELDSLINNPVCKEGVKKYLTFRLIQVEKKLYDRAELIIHLNNNKDFYEKKRYKKYLKKSVYTDIPYLVDKGVNVNRSAKEEKKTCNTILMLYAGHLSKDYRSPGRLIEIVKEISKYINIECLFFSRGDCEDQLRKAEMDTDGVIRRMGYVSQDVLGQYMDRADFLLDIGNRLSGEDYSLPSKVIEYMATGKPIIHMNGVNDSAIKYLEKYGNAINIPGDISVEQAGRDALLFIKDARGKRIPFEKVAEKFPENTPEYTADLIVKQINKRKSGAQ